MDYLIKTCAVQYLNTKPIVYGLEEKRLPHRFEMIYDIPSACADKLLRKEVDLALIPAIEYSRIRAHRNLKIVPSVAVVSHGSVDSVSLFFNRGLSNIQKIAVDQSSRTSVALLQIILREKFDIVPELIPMEPSMDAMLKAADAALIIGDKALEIADADNRLDLGEEWTDLTDGLPFVYSFWAGADQKLSPSDVSALIQSRDIGVHHISDIGYTYAETMNVQQKKDFYVSYLTDRIRFYMGKEEMDGLKEYYSYCYYYGFIDEIPEIQFYPECEPAFN